MRVSEKLGLKVSQHELDFVDVDLDKDCPLYIDPFLISNSSSQWAVHANRVIKNFFDCFKSAIKYKDYARARELFEFMSEPKENCLGVSKTGTRNGRGVGELNTKKILERIIQSDAIEKNLVRNIEDIIIFVEDIDKDKLSDMTTNIIRKQLVQYTNEQCKLWGIQTEVGETLPYWNPVEREWTTSEENLLIIDGREILLVPKFIVSPINVFEMSKYRWHFIVEQERDFHLQRRSELVRYRMLKGGKLRPYVIKKDVDEALKNQVIVGEYSSTKDHVRKYTQAYPELFERFLIKSKSVIKPLTSSEISKSIEDYDLDEIIDVLSSRLRNIPTGRKHASEYHRFVLALLDLLFYPCLINPVIEQEIHDGRKRIDIVMDNNDTKGFFYKLATINRVFCPYVYFECKNYTEDIANAELDQLAGRFGVTRGQFGMLICRDLQDKELFIKRCKDTYIDGRGLILVVTDQDILQMLEAVRNEDFGAVWEVLERKKREVIL